MDTYGIDLDAIDTSFFEPCIQFKAQSPGLQEKSPLET